MNMDGEDKKLLSDFLEGYMELHYYSGKGFNTDDLVDKTVDFIESLGYEFKQSRKGDDVK